jgi:hypothetical protein
MARQRSSARPVMRATLTPASGRNFGLVEQRAGRELVAAHGLGSDGDGAEVGVGALAEGDVLVADVGHG